MRDYGKVYSTFWSSATTSNLSDDGKLLALYLMTCSHSTIAGVFRLPDGYISEDLDWVTERVSKGFAELFAKGFANRCGTTKWVWIRKHLEWNKPENPNQRKSAAKIALSIPDECGWKLDFMRVCGRLLDIEFQAKDNPSETLAEPFLNQKQEQKQEQEQERGEAATALQPPPPPPAKPEKPKREQTTLAVYIEACRAARIKPIPDDHHVKAWATDAGLAPEMLQIAWVQFKDRYLNDEKAKGKRYKDWPGHFANAVKANWFKLWFMGDDNRPAWTSIGLTHKKALDAKQQREAAHA